MELQQGLLRFGILVEDIESPFLKAEPGRAYSIALKSEESPAPVGVCFTGLEKIVLLAELRSRICLPNASVEYGAIHLSPLLSGVPAKAAVVMRVEVKNKIVNY